MKLITADEAQATVLRRRPWDADRLPEAVRQRTIAAFREDLSPQEAVTRVFDDVAARGDAAVRDYTERLDGVRLEDFEVPRARWDEALAGLDPALRAALSLAAERIRAFHQALLPSQRLAVAVGAQPVEDPPGRAVPAEGEGAWLRWTPVARAGVHVPGGLASYPSSLLMTAIPASVAGVDEVTVVTPPGRLFAPLLAAAALAGVHRLFRVGGIQAIAALAHGTESIPKVDVIAGPGNLFVQLAKQRAFGMVGIDGLYGPTEMVLIADDSADPAWCAADLLAQAEHDPLATPLCFTPSRSFAEAVQQQVQAQLRSLPRSDDIQAALQGQGAIVLVRDIAEAIALANDFAPEHVSLAVRDAEPWLPLVRHAGGVFLGEGTPESLGDYVVGPSHVMPTSGSARFTSVLNVHHFLKATAVFATGPALMRSLAPAAVRIAQEEGLPAHANAVALRLSERRS